MFFFLSLFIYWFPKRWLHCWNRRISLSLFDIWDFVCMYFFLATSVKALNSTSWEKIKGWVGKKKKLLLTTPVSKGFYSLYIYTNNGPTICTTKCLFYQRDACRSHRGIALEVTRSAKDGSHITVLSYLSYHERISSVLSFDRSVDRSLARWLVRSVDRSFRKRKFTNLQGGGNNEKGMVQARQSLLHFFVVMLNNCYFLLLGLRNYPKFVWLESHVPLVSLHAWTSWSSRYVA